MNCRDVLDLASGYLDGELTEELCDRVRRHLLRCGSCREEVDSLRAAVEVLRATQTPAAPSEEYLQAALESLARELDLRPEEPLVRGQLTLSIADCGLRIAD